MRSDVGSASDELQRYGYEYCARLFTGVFSPLPLGEGPGVRAGHSVIWRFGPHPQPLSQEERGADCSRPVDAVFLPFSLCKKGRASPPPVVRSLRKKAGFSAIDRPSAEGPVVRERGN